MHEFFFYLFAGLTLLCGFLVVANPFSRNPVTSAMFLVLTIVSMAGLFVLLGAFFLAAVQILVYAGAVMVLFLFVIMLLNIQEEERRRMRLFATTLGAGVIGAMVILLLRAFLPMTPANASATPVEGSISALGKILFTKYLLPFEIISLLLLVAMVGVILISKKELR